MAWQAQQICVSATQKAGAPGMLSQAGSALNAVLSDLCQTYDLDVAKATTVLNIASSVGPYTLPATYLRTLPGEVFITYNNVPYPLVPLDLAEFDALIQQPGLMSIPTMFATDMSQTPPVIYFWPPPNGTYPVTIRFYQQMPDITVPETNITVPWFPNTDYLDTKTTAHIMDLVDDTRAQQFHDRAEGILNKYLKLKDDSSDRSMRVKLDRRFFGQNYNRLPVTKNVGF